MTLVVFKECGKPADLDVVDENVQHSIAEVKGLLVGYRGAMPLEDRHELHQRLERLAARTVALLKALEGPRQVTVECPFEGDIELQISGPPGMQKETWTCPL
jgi:hypothetical protein